MKKLSDDFICRDHSKEQISYWVKNLKYFYLRMAYYGHDSSGDQFIANIDFMDTNDLISKLTALGVEAKEPTSDDHDWYESKRGGTRIKHPYYTTIFGVECYIYIRETIKISLSGGNGHHYQVSDVDFNKCKLIEEGLDTIESIPHHKNGRYISDIAYISQLLYEDYYI